MNVKISNKGRELMNNHSLSDKVVKEIMAKKENDSFKENGISVSVNGDKIVLRSVAATKEEHKK
jgi:16S rRNA C1402 N4-methylase RsmH